MEELKQVSMERLFVEPVRTMEEVFFRTRKRDLYKFVLDAVEKPLISMVLEKTYGNQVKASKILGINRNTLRNKIKKLNIDVGKCKEIF